MIRWHRWVGLYVGAVVATVLVSALAYNVGMATIENDPQSLLRSLEVVLVHFFTVGYDTEFPSSGPMRSLVALVSITGQLVVSVGLLGGVALAVRELSSSGVRS